MFRITCLDENGELLSGFTQWDNNRTIHFKNYKYDFAPMFHFCNKFSKKSLGVKSVLSDGKLSVDVPNELLREPCPIIVYVFLSENDTGKTLQTIHLPVRPRVQPSDYEYVDNIKVVYLEDLIAEVKECIGKYDASELVRVENETIRIENENQRIANENQRQVNEKNRQVTSANAVSACNQATDSTLRAKELVDGLLYDIDGGNAFTNPDTMFQIDGGNCESNNG